MLYTLILLQFLHSMTVHRDLQINHTDNMFQLYYTESVKFCFKYTYASFHSSGLIVSLSGMMRSHSSLNSSVRKSSGMLKTPDSIATSWSCSSLTGKPEQEINGHYINTFINHLFCFLKQYPFVTCINREVRDNFKLIHLLSVNIHHTWMWRLLLQGSFPFPEKCSWKEFFLF